MTATDDIVLIVVALLVLRAARELAIGAANRFDRLLSLLEQNAPSPGAPRRATPADVRDFPDDYAPEPPPIRSTNDRVLYELEKRRHDTEGARASSVCQQWDEEDERLAQEEAERLTSDLKALGVTDDV